MKLTQLGSGGLMRSGLTILPSSGKYFRRILGRGNFTVKFVLVYLLAVVYTSLPSRIMKNLISRSSTVSLHLSHWKLPDHFFYRCWCWGEFLFFLDRRRVLSHQILIMYSISHQIQRPSLHRSRKKTGAGWSPSQRISWIGRRSRYGNKTGSC